MTTLVILGVMLFVWFIFCYCLKRICEKCDTEPGILIWIPIFNLIPMLQAAGLSSWLILLFFVPLLNIVMGLVMWVKICQARGKSALLVIMLFIPLLNLLFIPYLAFSE